MHLCLVCGSCAAASDIAANDRLGRSLRIAAVSMADGESLLSTQPVDRPTHAAPDRKDSYGLGAVMGRFSHHV
ncbi:hypothetical protein N9Y00_11970 [Tateyamaria sp.]|nr:hypothetical protein [Tateyamaria sp.]